MSGAVKCKDLGKEDRKNKTENKAFWYHKEKHFPLVT
jgi:hypothetical protein